MAKLEREAFVVQAYDLIDDELGVIPNKELFQRIGGLAGLSPEESDQCVENLGVDCPYGLIGSIEVLEYDIKVQDLDLDID